MCKACRALWGKLSVQKENQKNKRRTVGDRSDVATLNAKPRGASAGKPYKAPAVKRKQK
jgi:hypothetical protein